MREKFRKVNRDGGCLLESLEPRLLLSAVKKVGKGATLPLPKLTSGLDDLYRAAVVSKAALTKAELLYSVAPAPLGMVPIEAYAVTPDKTTALAAALKKLGAKSVNVSSNTVGALIAGTKLKQVNNLAMLRKARPILVQFSVGSTTAQGDVSMKADVARTVSGYNGAGIKVGVMSDSFNYLGGYAADVTSGDLPANMQIIKDIPSGYVGTDEGRGMAQIVYDSAPGSTLLFATAYDTQAAFANNIHALADAGAKVIVDDIIYFDEPMFSDGVIAQAVDSVVTGQGVSYFSSAGNEARQSYESVWRAGTNYSSGAFTSLGTAPAFGGGLAFDFDSGAGVNNFNALTLASGAKIQLEFQWDQPFLSSTNSVGSGNDLDIYLLDSSNRVVAGSTDDNVGTGDPCEFFSFQNTSGSSKNYKLVIVWYNSSGPTPTRIKYVDFASNATGVAFTAPSATAYGHTNAASCESVAAAWYQKTPAFGTNPPQVESYSSQGGVPILFDVAGNRLPNPVIRNSPDITAPDGVNTTFFGSDNDGDGKPNFFGTSAAAPAAAAVAALMLQKNPTMPASQVYAILEASAIDMDDTTTGGFDVGYDYKTGWGLIQADIAVANTPLQTSAAPGTPDLVNASDTGTSNSDDVTKLNNSSTGTKLTFQVSGTVAGATVSIYANGNLIGSAVAAGAVTNVTTNGSFTLADNTYTITARQAEVNKAQSTNSAGLSVKIDATAPTVGMPPVLPNPRNTPVASASVVFSEAITGFDLSDLSLALNAVVQTLTGANAPTSGDQITFTIPGLSSLTTLPGSYVLAMSNAGITDVAGNALVSGTSSSWTSTAAPAAPSGLVVTITGPSTASASWADNSGNEEAFLLTYALDAGFTSGAVTMALPANTTGTTLSGLTAGTNYFFKVTSFTAIGGESSAATTSSATPSLGALPGGWNSTDIGTYAQPGYAGFNSGTFTLGSTGFDIGGSLDAFQFASMSASGDFTLTARLDTQTLSDAGAKAGIMIRSSLSSLSPFVGLFVTPAGNVVFETRDSFGAAAVTSAAGSAVLPVYLRIVRSGATLTAYTSIDDVTYTPVGSISLDLGATVQAGLAVTSHGAGYGVGTFSGVTLL